MYLSMKQTHLIAALKLLCIAVPTYMVGSMLYMNNEPTRHFIDRMTSRRRHPLTSQWASPTVHSCADPSGILYGIFTTSSKMAQRQVFREKMAPHPNVTVRFIIGTPDSEDDFLQLSAEQAAFGDIMILDCMENMNEGKTYTYFRSASPCFSNYIKADDDTAVSLERLHALFSRLDASKPKCIGRIMYPTGIISMSHIFAAWLRNRFANMDWYYAVQKLSKTNLGPEEISGDEDRRTAFMMQEMGVEFVDVGAIFHDHPAYRPWFIDTWSMDISNQTVAVHKCKTVSLLIDAFEKISRQN